MKKDLFLIHLIIVKSIQIKLAWNEFGFESILLIYIVNYLHNMVKDFSDP